MAALTLVQPTQIGAGTWRYTYSGTAPFRRYCKGALVASPTDTTTGYSDDTFLVVEDVDDLLEPPVVEVYDSTDTTSVPLQLENASRTVLQWRGSEGDAMYYLTYWNGVAYVPPLFPYVMSQGLGYYQYAVTTPETGSETWRITTMLEDGTESDDVDITVVLVPNPDPPSISMTYSAGTGLVTIAAR